MMFEKNFFNLKRELNTNLKIKAMQEDEMLLAIDRLTRFKIPEIKYNRVFKEILAKHLIEPKIGFKDYEKLEAKEIVRLIEFLFKYSVNKLPAIKNFAKNKPSELQTLILELEEKIFNIDNETKFLMQAIIPYETIISAAENSFTAKNLVFLKYLQKELSAQREVYTTRVTHGKNINIDMCDNRSNLIQTPMLVREKYATKFPIEKIVLIEGITEEILLPKFAKIMGVDFEQNGVELIAAGGKRQVAKDYVFWSKQIKIPITIILDYDAFEIANVLQKNLRKIDDLILIKNGEFEDILPIKLIKKAINFKYRNTIKLKIKDFAKTGRVRNLEEIYRINGLGEFKKAEFARNVETVLTNTSKTLISNEIREIINMIAK